MTDRLRTALESIPWWLVVVDVAIVATVLATGMAFHGNNPFDAPRRTFLTVLPFVIGWLLGGPAAGAYRRAVRTSVGRTTISVTVGWLVASLIGSGLRALPTFPGSAPMVFVGVTFGTVAIPLLAWRVGYVFARGDTDVEIGDG